jgi:hypothetical protein
MKQPGWSRGAGSNQAGWEGRKQLGRGGGQGSSQAGGGKDEATRLEQRSREQPGRVFPMNFMIRM